MAPGWRASESTTMTELRAILGFFILVALLVARIRQEGREQNLQNPPSGDQSKTQVWVSPISL